MVGREVRREEEEETGVVEREDYFQEQLYRMSIALALHTTLDRHKPHLTHLALYVQHGCILIHAGVRCLCHIL